MEGLMAYTPATLNCIVDGGINSRNGGLWTYFTTDAPATVDTANYLADAAARGMTVGDIVFVVNSSTFATQIMICASVVAGAGVNLTDGLAVAATNTD
jgi:hypothetical protein